MILTKHKLRKLVNLKLTDAQKTFKFMYILAIKLKLTFKKFSVVNKARK